MEASQSMRFCGRAASRERFAFVGSDFSPLGKTVSRLESLVISRPVPNDIELVFVNVEVALWPLASSLNSAAAIAGGEGCRNRSRKMSPELCTEASVSPVGKSAAPKNWPVTQRLPAASVVRPPVKYSFNGPPIRQLLRNWPVAPLSCDTNWSLMPFDVSRSEPNWAEAEPDPVLKIPVTNTLPNASEVMSVGFTVVVDPARPPALTAQRILPLASIRAT